MIVTISISIEEKNMSFNDSINFENIDKFKKAVPLYLDMWTRQAEELPKIIAALPKTIEVADAQVLPTR